MSSEGDNWGELAKNILALEALVGFLILTGFFIRFGVAPAAEYVRSLISISPYWRGVLNTLFFLFVAMLFVHSLRVAPGRGYQ